MKILAIESSGLVASVAVWSDGCLLGEFSTNFKKTHSQTLMPMLDEMMRLLGIPVSEINALAVSAGPGSFTGLRIGSATVKGIGLALDLPVIEVPTVDGIAYNLYGYPGVICPMMDARRSQVYTGLYSFEGDVFRVLTPQKAVDVHEILDEINALGRPVIFNGDGVPVYASEIASCCTVPYSLAPAHAGAQRAGTLAALAALYYKEGRYVSADDHQPDYLRLSQAERELAARQQAASDAAGRTEETGAAGLPDGDRG